MTERLMRGGHRVVGFDPKEEARKRVAEKDADSAVLLEALTTKLKPSRTLRMMVPAGAVTDATIDLLLPLPEAGDTLIDGAIRTTRTRCVVQKCSPKRKSTISTPAPVPACGASNPS